MFNNFIKPNYYLSTLFWRIIEKISLNFINNFIVDQLFEQNKLLNYKNLVFKVCVFYKLVFRNSFKELVYIKKFSYNVFLLNKKIRVLKLIR